MSPTQTTRSQKARFALIAIAAVLMAAAPVPARAQAFANLKSALVDYSKADMAPHKTCEALANFKSKEIVQSKAVMVPADAAAPAHCSVTGLLAPEIAFEVSLPSLWNGRFYMIGNGGHAGESLTDPGRVAQRNAALGGGGPPPPPPSRVTMRPKSRARASS